LGYPQIKFEWPENNSARVQEKDGRGEDSEKQQDTASVPAVIQLDARRKDEVPKISPSSL
jgi:hypothetical protein